MTTYCIISNISKLNNKGLIIYFTFAIAIAIAVLPVPGYPASKIDLPAIFPSLIILNINPAALLASFYPTNPCEILRASNESSSPSPLI